MAKTLKNPPKMRKAVPEKKEGTKAIDHDWDRRQTVRFDETNLPEVKDWKIGEKYCLVIEVQQISSSLETDGADKGNTKATFAIEKVGVKKDDK